VRGGEAGGFLQHGTPYWGGGMAVVGEGGAEVVRMPQGAAVYPSYSQTTQNVVNNTDNRRYSTTNNVSDALAAAMVMEQQRRMETAQLNALM
jgi:predicted 2-oxoglutarate/Fe(II)-dependent dioxygenase YbiX